jgi:hypothetical protein
MLANVTGAERQQFWLTSLKKFQPQRLRLRLQLAADSLDFAKYPQKVAAQNLLDVFGAVPAIEKCLRDFWQVGGRVNSTGKPLTPSKSEPRPA